MRREIQSSMSDARKPTALFDKDICAGNSHAAIILYIDDRPSPVLAFTAGRRKIDSAERRESFEAVFVELFIVTSMVIVLALRLFKAVTFYCAHVRTFADTLGSDVPIERLPSGLLGRTEIGSRA